MKTQYMYHCTACSTSEPVTVGPFFLGRVFCAACGGRARMVSSGLTKAQWDALSEEQQARVYGILSVHRCENKRWGVLLLIGMCALLWLVTSIAPILATFEAKPSVLFACALVYLIVYDYDQKKKFAACAAAVQKALDTPAEASGTEENIA